MNLNILRVTVSLLLSAAFFLSAIGKQLDMDAFEMTLHYYGLGIDASAILGRLIISGEFLLSIGLWIPGFRRLSALGIAAMTVVLSFGLAWFYVQYPEAEDCGCHGQLLQLDPLTSLIKNGVLILLALILWRLNVPSGQSRWGRWMMILTGLASFAVPPIISPPDFVYRSGESLSQGESFVERDLLNSIVFTDGFQPWQHEDERYMLLFASPGCKFCKLMATRLDAMSRTGQTTLPVFVIFSTTDSGTIAGFWEETKAIPMPWTGMADFNEFLKLSGPSLPALFLMKGEQYYARFTYRNMSPRLIREFESMP